MRNYTSEIHIFDCIFHDFDPSSFLLLQMLSAALWRPYYSNKMKQLVPGLSGGLTKASAILACQCGDCAKQNRPACPYLTCDYLEVTTSTRLPCNSGTCGLSSFPTLVWRTFKRKVWNLIRWESGLWDLKEGEKTCGETQEAEHRVWCTRLLMTLSTSEASHALLNNCMFV